MYHQVYSNNVGVIINGTPVSVKSTVSIFVSSLKQMKMVHWKTENIPGRPEKHFQDGLPFRHEGTSKPPPVKAQDVNVLSASLTLNRDKTTHVLEGTDRYRWISRVAPGCAI